VGRLGRNETVTVPVRDDGTAGPFQWIDARDLAAFMLALVEAKRAGTWNGAAPWIPFLEAIDRMKAALGSASEVRTVAEPPDRERDPLVLPPDGRLDPLIQVSGAAALTAGLTLRPLEDSARDTWAWVAAAPETAGRGA
jgi:2'-hydroxyisoflavone reductase